ncbi:MAG: CHAT domain-containing protein, partial [Actinobacteria bacterium]|nr:CHAT domain-containing protein [Actinomycetota bacterium]
AWDAPPTVEELRVALGDAALVELVDFEGEIHAVAVSGRKAVLVTLGATAEIEAEVSNLRFAVSRLARPHRPQSRGAVDALAHASRRLDELLLLPLENVIDGRSLVVIPTGSLHAMPWATLPSLSGRAVTVCPSAALWLRAVSSHRPAAGDTVLAAGPGLSHAAEEVRAVSDLHPRTTILVGADATTLKVLSALRGADLVHVVAHGTFRDDNALFSSLRLVDGPLTAYDLEQLDRMPRRMVLSACEAGLSTVRPGNELMGVSSALLSLGVETLVASVVPVSDSFSSLRLVDGQLTVSASHAQAAGFVCFGSG